MRISLIVIRCKDIEVSKSFYEKLGLSFLKEKHGNGPEHYSWEHNDLVFELYPNKGEAPKDNNRIGFKVSEPAKLAKKLDVIESYNHKDSTIYVVTDPDGRKVEISE